MLIYSINIFYHEKLIALLRGLINLSLLGLQLVSIFG